MTDFFNLKILAISHFISRSGTLYLHSLLDDHPEIATIPGTFDITELLKVKENQTSEECYEIFKKNNPKFFDTSKFTFADKNNSSLWILGENKNDKILTNEFIFKKNFLNHLKDIKINPRNVLISLYFAYAKTHNKNLEKVKIILMHPHEKKTTLEFYKFFTDALFLIPIRNPIKAYEGIIKKVRFVSKQRKQFYYPSGQLIESALDIDNFYKKKLTMYFIRLEDLGENMDEIMSKISKILNINFCNSMLKSTFEGKKYWSNSVEKQTNHFDKSRHTNETHLSRKDLIILNLINYELIKCLNYESIKINTLEKFYTPILLFLPMVDEINFLKKFKLSKFLIYLKFLVFYLPKRLRIIQIMIFNKFSKRYKYISERLLAN